ncbi:uncharacterized protein LOC143823825 isoform X2 [Paroedura picta]
MTVQPHEGAQAEGQTDIDRNTLVGRGSPPTGTESELAASPSAKKTTSEALKTSSSGDLQTPSSLMGGCFTFDGVFNLDTGKDKLFFEHLLPVLSRMPFGYSVSLLLCEAHHCEPQGEGFVQKIYTNGKVQDLLKPGSQGLQIVDLPPLGLVVEKAAEMVVDDSQMATDFYLQGVLHSQEYLQQELEKQLKTLFGTLLTVTLEQRAEGQSLRRATLRIFEFAGEDELSSAERFSPLLSACSAGALPAEVDFLSWVLKQLLTGNALTFALFNLTLPGTQEKDIRTNNMHVTENQEKNPKHEAGSVLQLTEASGREVLSTLWLAEQVKSVSKRVAPTCWHPAREAQKRRAAIGELRDQLFFSGHLEHDSRLSQLGQMLKELQVLKSQSWKEKKETSAACERIIRSCPDAKGQIASDKDSRVALRNHLGSHLPQADTQQETKRSDLSATEDGRITTGGAGQATAHQEAAAEEKPSKVGAHDSKGLKEASEASSPSWAAQQDINVRFSLAKAKRQCLQEEHRLLIQQQFLRTEEKLAGQEKLPPEQQEALHWQKEKSLLTLRLEALQKEQAEAERDLEELYQEHLREAEAQKHHILQVFQAYKGHAEEQLEALERRYRKLLQASLQDAITLSAQNERLRAQGQLARTDGATQTEPQPT